MHARLRWLCAELLHHADGVFFTPVFYDLPIRDPHDIDTCKAYSIARGRKSKKVADMCTSHSDARDNLIALCDQLFNFCVPVGHAKQRCLMDLLRPLQAGGIPAIILGVRKCSVTTSLSASRLLLL